MTQCTIILKSVHRHEILHECKVAISKATLHFQKVTKEQKQKQKRVDNGNEKVETAVALTTKNDNFARSIKLNCTTTTWKISPNARFAEDVNRHWR